MAFALVQDSLQSPTVRQLLTAFASTPQAGLTVADAYLIARDNVGVLLRGLQPDNAESLQRGLGQQGLAVEVVDEDHLPVLPLPTGLKKADCLTKALTVYDSLAAPIAWTGPACGSWRLGGCG